MLNDKLLETFNFANDFTLMLYKCMMNKIFGRVSCTPNQRLYIIITKKKFKVLSPAFCQVNYVNNDMTTTILQLAGVFKSFRFRILIVCVIVPPAKKQMAAL